MKFLHIITFDGQASDRTVKFVCENFDQDEHMCILLDYPENYDHESAYKNYIHISTEKMSWHNIRMIKNLFKSAQYVIWHGIFLRLKWLLLLNFFHKFDDKFIWITQGADLYTWRIDTNVGSWVHRKKAKMFNRLGLEFRKRVSFFGSEYPPDKYYFEKNINPHGQMFDISYQDSRWMQLIQQYVSYEQTEEKDDAFKILVGFNASPINSHIDILNSLVNFRYKNVKLYIPLVGEFGNRSEYVEEVREYADLMYGDKAICITDKISDEEYISMLCSSDIVISRATHHAVRIHNIYESVLTALSLGKTVYLLKKSGLYSFLTSKNVDVKIAENIYSLTLEELIESSKEGTKAADSDFIKDWQMKCENASLWRDLLSSMEDESKPVSLLKPAKFLHIVRPSDESKISVIQNHFDEDEHAYILLDYPESCFKELPYKNYVHISTSNTSEFEFSLIKELFRASQYIIWHGIFLNLKWLSFFDSFREFDDKFVWISQGTDLYSWRMDTTKGDKRQQENAKQYNLLGLEFRKRISCFGSDYPPDRYYFEGNINPRGYTFDISYLDSRWTQLIQQSVPYEPTEEENDGTFKILVGFNTSPINRHLEILNSLANLRDENIQLYILLAGNFANGKYRKYAADVCKRAKSMYGNKAICITDEISEEEYISLLRNSDIVISRTVHPAVQCHKIYESVLTALSLGKTVYLSKKSGLYSFLTSKNVDVKIAENMYSLTIEELIESSEDGTKAADSKFIKDWQAKCENASMWGGLLSSMDGESKPVSLLRPAKFLHIIRPSEELSMSILQNNFYEDEHAYILLDYPESCFKKLPFKNYAHILTSKTSETEFSLIKELFRASQCIIWHGIFLNLKWLSFLDSCREFDDKFVWISQGTDIYSWQMDTTKGSKSQQKNAKLYNRLGLEFRKRISYFGSEYPPNKYYFEKLINPHGRMFDVNYLDNRWTQLIQQHASYEPKEENDDTFKILVGFNASPINRHLEILSSLANLCDENIQLYIPLMEGIASGKYRKYIADVRKRAESMYGDKAICITDEISEEEYISLLRNSDIVISRTMHPAVQCHKIYECVLTALSLGKTVYLRKKSSLYSFLTSKKVDIKIAENIYSSTLEELIKSAKDGVKAADSEFIKDLQAKCEGASLWRNLFFSMKGESKPVKFLHVIRPSEELATPIIEIVQNNFNIEEHRFLVNRRISLRLCEKLTQFSIVSLFLIGKTQYQRFRYFYKQLKGAENIIWHGFYVGYGKPIMEVKELILLSLYPKFLKKITWVGWGADLHDWKAEESGTRGIKRLKTRFFNRLSEKARKSVPYFISIFPPDGENFKEQFGTSARVFDGTYSNIHFTENLESVRPTKQKNYRNDPINIMVGHSANTWNYHIEILNSLAKYRYENIRIYIPLSTGVDEKYKRLVKSHAKNLFGEKAICIFKKMSLKNYTKFLWAMDIAVFKLDRQAALGNLMNLFYMGKKIFLPANTVMYDFFLSQGVDVHDTGLIGKIPFSDFSAIRENAELPQYILDRTDKQKIVEKWRYIFTEIDSEKAK